MSPRFIPLVLFLIVSVVASPASAQRVSTGDRLAALEQQLAASRTGNLDLLNQITQLRTELQSLRSQNEELQQMLDQQKQLGRTQYLDLDGRLNRLEAVSTLPPSTAVTPTLPSATTTTTTATTTAVAKPIATPLATATVVPTTPAVQDTPPRIYGDPVTLGRSGDERGTYNAA